MPKTLYLPDQDGNGRSGIDITWTPSADRLDIGGWYDSFVGIGTTSLSLGEFFSALGITRKHIERSLKERKKDKAATLEEEER